MFKYSVVLALFVMVACTKGIESGIPESNDSSAVLQNAQDALVFTVTREETKADLGLSGAMAWAATDVVVFFNGTDTIHVSPTEIQGSTAIFSIARQGFAISSGKYFAAFPASMVDGFNAADSSVRFKSYVGGVQSKATSFRAVASCGYDKTTLSFKNVSYVFRITNPGGSGISPSQYSFIALDGSAVSAPLTVTMRNDDVQSITRGTDSSDAVACVTAPLEDGVAYINVDPFVANNGWAIVASDATTSLGIKVVDKKKTFARGSFRNLAFVPDPTPPSPDPTIGGFEFAPGNLYFDADSSGWGVEARQYDFRTWGGSPCCINGVYNTTSASGEGKNIGLFFWHVNADSAKAVSYSAQTSVYTDPQIFADNLSNVKGLPGSKSDFGSWHVMTKDEVNGLVGTDDSTVAARSRFRARAKIVFDNDQYVTGSVLLPDVFDTNEGIYKNFTYDSTTGTWSFPYGFQFKTVQSRETSGSFNDNVLSMNQWALLDYLGCVFLPAAGRCGADRIFKGEDLHALYYWTGSYYGYKNNTHKSRYIYGVNLETPTGDNFDSDMVTGACNQAFAIRLVRKKNTQ